MNWEIPQQTAFILAHNLLKLLHRLAENKLVHRGLSFSKITLPKAQNRN